METRRTESVNYYVPFMSKCTIQYSDGLGRGQEKVLSWGSDYQTKRKDHVTSPAPGLATGWRVLSLYSHLTIRDSTPIAPIVQ